MTEEEDREKALTEAKREAGTLRRRLAEAEAALSAAADAHAKELADTRKAAADEVRAALRAEHAQQLAQAEVRVAAAKRLADPEDADKFLELADLVKDGQVDKAAVGKAIDQLLERKPYLAAQVANGAGKPGSGDKAPPAPRVTGDGDQGPRPNATAQPNAAMNDMIRKAVSH